MDGRDLEEGFFWTVGGEWGRFGVLKEELGREVLRDVSRSFYLTLRLLPEGMRDATSVGYLLARLSDTIADCGGARSERMELLGRYQEVLRTGVEGGFLGKLAGIGEDAGLSEGERVLVRRFREVLQWWGELEAWKRREVREVALRISGGQLWDLKRFPEGEVVRLERGEELEEYCYAVAGCVGEFWTEVGFGCEEGFARKSREEMRELGRRYGKGLQLVNILRDEGEDEERGRRYLPTEREEWLEVAAAYLRDGLAYARELRGRRARMATVLPALIGLETLALLREAGREEFAGKVKVSRGVVWRCLLRAVFW